jgi:polyisoprenoid-binding protein YceI
MKKAKLVTGALLVIVISACVGYQATEWKVRDNYSVKVFRNQQLQFPIVFKGLKAEILFDKENPENSKVSATIDATTVDTGNPSMTEHAREEDVLNTEKFKEITFKSSVVKKTTTGYEVTGDFTLKGITKQITFPFTFEKETFIGEFTIAAADFKITREGAVPNGQIRIELNIPVTK